MSVYALHDPRTGSCRYVGRSALPERRFRQHIVSPHSPGLRRWVRELRASGLEPEMRVLGIGTEQEWIARLTPDLNIITGAGDGECDRGMFVTVRVSADRAKLFERLRRRDGRTKSGWALRAIEEKLTRDSGDGRGAAR